MDQNQTIRAYTLDEAAERLQVTRQTLYNLEKRGELRVIRLGRAVRVPASELARLIDGEAATCAI